MHYQYQSIPIHLDPSQCISIHLNNNQECGQSCITSTNPSQEDAIPLYSVLKRRWVRLLEKKTSMSSSLRAANHHFFSPCKSFYYYKVQSDIRYYFLLFHTQGVCNWKDFIGFYSLRSHDTLQVKKNNLNDFLCYTSKYFDSF